MNLRSFSLRLGVIALTAFATLAALADDTPASQTTRRRRVTPIVTGATTTQSINETRDDTSRINAAFRARSSHYHREDGAIVYVDTVTGEQWIDSAAMPRLVHMKYPLLVAVNGGIDIWDPVMRLFGQKYGLFGLSFDVSLHNRYFPAFEIGLGYAQRTPTDGNYTYKSPLSVYFKIGANYNFLYNSNPDYAFFAGVRYGFSPFSWSVDNVTLQSPYWHDDATFNIPSIRATAGWIEFALGLRVKLAGNISAGWMFKYHQILHESKDVHGQPWYIPGYGARGQSITGSFTITYSLPINKKTVPPPGEIIPDDERPDTLIFRGDTIIGPDLNIEA